MRGGFGLQQGLLFRPAQSRGLGNPDPGNTSRKAVHYQSALEPKLKKTTTSRKSNTPQMSRNKDQGPVVLGYDEAIAKDLYAPRARLVFVFREPRTFER